MLMITLVLMWALVGIVVILDDARRDGDIDAVLFVALVLAGAGMGPIALLATASRMAENGRFKIPVVIKHKPR